MGGYHCAFPVRASEPIMLTLSIAFFKGLLGLDLIRAVIASQCHYGEPVIVPLPSHIPTVTLFRG